MGEGLHFNLRPPSWLAAIGKALQVPGECVFEEVSSSCLTRNKRAVTQRATSHGPTRIQQVLSRPAGLRAKDQPDWWKAQREASFRFASAASMIAVWLMAESEDDFASVCTANCVLSSKFLS